MDQYGDMGAGRDSRKENHKILVLRVNNRETRRKVQFKQVERPREESSCRGLAFHPALLAIKSEFVK